MTDVTRKRFGFLEAAVIAEVFVRRLLGSWMRRQHGNSSSRPLRTPKPRSWRWKQRLPDRSRRVRHRVAPRRQLARASPARFAGDIQLGQLMNALIGLIKAALRARRARGPPGSGGCHPRSPRLDARPL